MCHPRKQDQRRRGGIYRPKRHDAPVPAPEDGSLPRPPGRRRPAATPAPVSPLPLLIATVLACTATPAAHADPPTPSPVSDPSSRLNRVESDLDDARREAAALSAGLRQADRRLAEAEHDLTAARRRFVKARRSSVDASEALSLATAEMWRQQALRGRQARHTYMTGGPLVQLTYLLGATSMTEAGRRYITLSRVTKDANDTLDRLRDARRRAAAGHAAMTAGERAAAAERLALAKQVKALDRARAVRAGTKRALDARIARLSRSRAHLQGEVLTLLAEAKQRDAAAHRRLVERRRRNQKLAGLAEAAGKARRSVEVVRVRGRCDLTRLNTHERWIVMRESGGNPTAGHRASTAFGLGQLTLANRLRYLGGNHSTTDCAKQVKAFRAYVANAYGSAKAAQSFWKANGWY